MKKNTAQAFIIIVAFFLFILAAFYFTGLGFMIAKSIKAEDKVLAGITSLFTKKPVYEVYRNLAGGVLCLALGVLLFLRLSIGRIIFLALFPLYLVYWVLPGTVMKLSTAFPKKEMVKTAIEYIKSDLQIFTAFDAGNFENYLFYILTLLFILVYLAVLFSGSAFKKE